MTFLDALPRQTERSWQAQVVKLAELLGYRVYHTWNSKHSAAGFPDLVLVRRPRCIFAELKSDRTRLTADQLAWLVALRECGLEVYVWRPSEWKLVERILKGRPDDRP